MRTLVDVMRRNGNDYLSVEFFGGEPLRNWPVIRHVLGTFKNQWGGVNILYSVTTNGSLITAEMASAFKAYDVTVTVSVDIPTKLTRLPLTVAKSADRIRDSLTLLREHGNTVTFNSVISKETLAHIDGRRLIDVAREYAVPIVGLILDLDLAFYRVPQNREQALGVLMDTYQYGREVGVKVTGYWHQIFKQIVGEQATVARSGYKTCPATGCKVSVEPDGSIFTCKCTSSDLGSISDFDQILTSDTYAEYAMQAYRHAPDCDGCEIEGFCSGVCMGSFENQFQRRDMIETGACDMFRRITRDLILDLPSSAAKPMHLTGQQA